ncbi:MAG TPA: ribonuclease HI family protein [bacterium]|nr:ribonuclease HI family protein [bacterium]
MPLFKDQKPLELTVFTDGAARGNPGPAAAAAVLIHEDSVVLERSKPLGNTTNNRAEYEAVILALEAALELNAAKVTLYTDSQLIARQIQGRYRVKNQDLQPLYERARELSSRLASFRIVDIRREKNKHADRLCNEVLDGVRN